LDKRGDNRLDTSLNLDQFRSAFRAGGLRSILIIASGGQFYLTAQPRTGSRITLATTHGDKLRAFRNPAKAIEILHQMGAQKVEIDISSWSPAQAKLEGRKRPDTADRQRRAHQAAAHDAWFRQQVELAGREADDPKAEWDSEAEVKRQSATKRAEWRGKAGARRMSPPKSAAV
jgi:hypothetical protein